MKESIKNKLISKINHLQAEDTNRSWESLKVRLT